MNDLRESFDRITTGPGPNRELNQQENKSTGTPSRILTVLAFEDGLGNNTLHSTEWAGAHSASELDVRQKKMSKRSKRVVIAMAVAMAAGVIAAFSYSGWRSTAALIPEWTVHSPDNEYRIEFYRVWTPNTWRFTAPGQSSDNIDGFIRLCRSDGTIIKEVFRTFLRVYEPRWHDDSVYFLGDDGPYWNLPRTAKQDSDGNAVKPPGVERES